MFKVLLELQRLKRLDRTGWVLRGLAPGAESVAAHSYGVAFAAMLLADEVRARGVEVDVERVLRIALLHDLAEARTGDMPRTMALYYGAEARRAAERAAFDDMVRDLGAARGARRRAAGRARWPCITGRGRGARRSVRRSTTWCVIWARRAARTTGRCTRITR